MTFWETFFKSILLGTVQGLTEFLPVSSSGHLTLLQRVISYGAGSAMFVNVMLHVGTLAAVVIALRREIRGLFRRPFKTLWMLAVATLPAAVVGVLFHGAIDALFAGEGGILALAVCFAVTAAALLLCEIVAGRRRTRPLSVRHAAWMGVAQAAALLPGISRSGATVVAGSLCGAKGEDVAKFSLLMSIPVILGSLLVESLAFLSPPAGIALCATSVADLPALISGSATVELAAGLASSSALVSALAADLPTLIVGIAAGMLSAAVSGFFAVKAMMKIVKKGNYKWFSLYLALLSLTLFTLSSLGILV